MSNIDNPMPAEFTPEQWDVLEDGEKLSFIELVKYLSKPPDSSKPAREGIDEIFEATCTRTDEGVVLLRDDPESVVLSGEKALGLFVMFSFGVMVDKMEGRL